MDALKFQFLFGQLLIDSSKYSKEVVENLVKMQNVQNILLDILPHRRNEISQFSLSCIQDLILNGQSSK